MLQELDAIAGSSGNPTYRRVKLGREVDKAPECKVYPFMLSNTWMKANPDADVHIYKKNPNGFDPRSDDDEEEDNMEEEDGA